MPIINKVDEIVAEQRRLWIKDEVKKHKVDVRKGRRNENRVADTVDRWMQSAKPDWLIGYRKASYEEDRFDGIDGFMLTTTGEIRIQIKSSFWGKKKYCKERPENQDVYILVVEEQTTDWSIRQLLTDAYKRRRNSHRVIPDDNRAVA
jgi:hypothetical protein